MAARRVFRSGEVLHDSGGNDEICLKISALPVCAGILAIVQHDLATKEKAPDSPGPFDRSVPVDHSIMGRS
jgi:hypothetical protein